MTVWDLLRVLRERWIIVVTAVVLGLLAGGVLYERTPVTYTASLPLYVATQTAVTPQAALQGAQLASQRVASYAELLSTTRVSTEVVKELGLPISAQALANNIQGSTTPDSVLIELSVTDTNPVRAAQIANSAASVFGKLVAELERPLDPKIQTPVTINIVQPAAVPTSPSSSGLIRWLLPGLLAGLIVGVALALLRSRMDKSVKDVTALAAVTGVANLAVIGRQKGAPLTTAAAPNSPRTEAFRKLRTSIQSIGGAKMVVVASASSGEGRSTTVANLAIALAAAHARVLVIDADLRKPAQAALLGVDPAVGLSNVLTSEATAAEAIKHWPTGGFDVLPSGPVPPDPSELLASNQMVQLLVSVRRDYDMVLIDTPPLLPVTDASVVARIADGVVLVCRAGRTSRSQLAGAVRSAQSVSARLLGTVLTMSKRPESASVGSDLGSAFVSAPANSQTAVLPVIPTYRVPQRVTPRNGGSMMTPRDSPTVAMPVVPAPDAVRANRNGGGVTGHDSNDNGASGGTTNGSAETSASGGVRQADPSQR